MFRNSRRSISSACLLLFIMSLTFETQSIVKTFTKAVSKQKIVAGIKTISKSLMTHKYKTGVALVLTGCAGLYFKQYQQRMAKINVLEGAKIMQDRFDALMVRAEKFQAKKIRASREAQEVCKKMRETIAALQIDEQRYENYSMRHVLACINKNTVTQNKYHNVANLLSSCELFLNKLESFLNTINDFFPEQDAAHSKALTLKEMREMDDLLQEKINKFNAEFASIRASLKAADKNWRGWAQHLLWVDLSTIFRMRLQEKIEYARRLRNQPQLDALNNVDRIWRAALSEKPANEDYLSKVCAVVARESHIFN